MALWFTGDVIAFDIGSLIEVGIVVGYVNYSANFLFYSLTFTDEF
jgi:hypothetical protein